MPPVAERTGPSWGEISHRLGRWMADQHGEWSGVPMPVAGMTLTVEDKNPWKDRLQGLQESFDEIENRGKTLEHACSDDDTNLTLLNTWYSRSQRCCVWVVRHGDGRVRAHRLDPDISQRSRFVIDTLKVAHVWSLDAEIKAVEKLGELIKPHLWEAYLFTGSFLETSPRSGVTYIFRRCRPTIALKATDEGSKILCALCLHPIGYYDGTFAGSMVPTDEVIAHLLLMRGDEALYWRRANQHPPYMPGSGL